MGDRLLLSLRELSAWYTADRPVLDGLNLDLAPGEVVGLIGLNGAGKTTFLKALSGLLPGWRAGSALWKGRPLSFRAESFKRERFVAFAEDRSFPYFTFREYLSYAAAAYGRPTPDVQALVAEFGFEPCTDVLLRELSTGNRKKAALRTADAYALLPAAPHRLPARRGRGRGSVFVYLARYLAANKNYLVNTAGLCLLAFVLPRLFGAGAGLFPVGLGILCLNTPLCTLLSGDPDLEQALRTLPGQAARFGRGYCLFLFGVNTLVAGLYLAGWLLAGGQPGAAALVPVFALQSAILSVGLEWLRPLRGWKTESELWHHPRKYLVPLVMLLLGAGVSAWPPLSALLAAALAVQCAALLWLTGRQKN